jgi:hypothetical protein
MSFDPTQFIELVIVPALTKIGAYSKAAEQLVAGTIAHESDFGTYLKQIGGPALGCIQMEPATHDDLWESYIPGKSFEIKMLPASKNRLLYDLLYAAQMCRIKYLSIPILIPAENDIEAQANYWKRYYNTPQGRGNTIDYLWAFKYHLGKYYPNAKYGNDDPLPNI